MIRLCSVVEARVPVDFAEVELEDAVRVGDFDVEIVWSSEDFVGKGAEDGFAADVFGFC